MSNSHSKYLLGLHEAMISDVMLKFTCFNATARLRKGLERDHLRLVLSVKSRGLRVLTIDLPAMGKDFDQSLHLGRMSFQPCFLTRTGMDGLVRPHLYGGLLDLVFDARGLLRHDADIRAIRSLRQFFLFAKKWRIPCADSFTYKEVREFYRVDQEVRRPTLNWREPYLPDWNADDLTFVNTFRSGKGVQERLPFEKSEGSQSLYTCGMDPSGMCHLLRILQKIADRLSAALGVFNDDDIVPKHGPGVVSDLKKGESKYTFPLWSDRLEQVFPLSKYAFANYGLWADFVRDELGRYISCENTGIQVKHLIEVYGQNPIVGDPLMKRFRTSEYYSKLIAVPKTQKGPRLIASEPTAHQWMQQVIHAWLRERSTHTWIGSFISFRDQTPNQVMALAASKDASLSTIDLSAASDRVSCWLVERVFRRNAQLLRALHATRTFIIRNPIDKKCPEFSFLNKFSTMGSACTFPIQSLIFLVICLAAAHFVDGCKVSTKSIKSYIGRIRVFGDDLIVPDHTAECVKLLLEHLGFKVNTSKTFSGPSRFRESCGVDAYAGEEVTPVYSLTQPMRSVPDSYVSCVATSHNFAKAGLWACVDYIRRTTTSEGLNNLPEVECGSGIFGWPSIFGKFDLNGCKTRWNESLQRMEYRTRRVKHVTRRRPDEGASQLLQYFVEQPLPDIHWMSGIVEKVRVLTRPSWEPIPA